MSLGFFSFIVNSILLILIDKNIFGSKIKIWVENVFNSSSRTRKTAICIYYFVFVYVLIFVVRYNMSTIYLDTVKVNVVINGVEADITGDILATAREVFGDATVFLGSARLAYLILAKNPALGAYSKIGISIVGGGGTGFTTYRIISRTSNYFGENRELVLNGNLKLGNVVVNTTGNYANIPQHPVLDFLFGMNKSVSVNNIGDKFTTRNYQGQTILESNSEINTNSGIIRALYESNPNWKNNFENHIPTDNPYKPWTINSPYESESGLISFLIDNLTDHLILAIISTYLLLMLLIIFICKLLLSKNIEFQRLSSIKIFKWPLGEQISKLLTWFISIWQQSSSFWIFFIIIILIISNGASLFSFYTMLIILKNTS